MRKMITQVSFTRIPKLEFRAVVNGVVGIVAKYEPGEMHIDGSYNLVTEAMPLLKNLRNRYKRHPKTASLMVLRKQRKDLLIAITAQTKALMTAHLAAHSAMLEVFVPFAEEHLTGIQEENAIKQGERVILLLTDLMADQSVLDAFVGLGLMPYVDQLKTIQQQIDETFDTRVKSKSIRLRAKTGEVKSALAESLNDLLNDIELAQKKYPAIDYAPLINELNAFLVPIQAKIKSLNTRRKHAKNDPSAIAMQAAEKVA